MKTCILKHTKHWLKRRGRGKGEWNYYKRDEIFSSALYAYIQLSK
jgi:hypothetical protein